MLNPLAFLSAGKLFIRREQDKPLEHTSTFAQEMIDKAIAQHQRHGWKTRDDGQSMTGRMLWGVNIDPTNLRVHITAVEKGASKDEVIYALATDVAGGVFTYNFETKRELRLFHREKLIITDLAKHPSSNEYACSMKNANGTASIALLETSSCRPFTEGDCIDEAPNWVPGSRKQIVYHSAGIGRNQSGMFVAIGPFAIQKLDFDSGDLTTVLEDNNFDFLLPKLRENGDLYYIKRPYETFRHRGGALTFVKDVVLFPFRLARAIFAFLDVFSITFSKKSLTTAGGPRTTGPEEGRLFLRGRIIEAQKTMSKTDTDADTHPIVPPAWELVVRRGDNEEVLAKGAVAFDFDEDGNVIYTNGRAVYKISGGKTELLFKSSLIESLVSLS